MIDRYIRSVIFNNAYDDDGISKSQEFIQNVRWLIVLAFGLLIMLIVCLDLILMGFVISNIDIGNQSILLILAMTTIGMYVIFKIVDLSYTMQLKWYVYIDGVIDDTVAVITLANNAKKSFIHNQIDKEKENENL